MKFDSIKAIHFRWLGAILLALCIFLPLVKTSREFFGEYNNQIIAIEFYNELMFRLEDDTLKLDGFFWLTKSAHIITLFIWPIIFLSVERLMKNRFLKYFIIAIEFGLSLLTLLFAFAYTYALLIYGSFHIGSALALISFGTYLAASITSIISMIMNRKKKPDLK